eukprot:CAMPEP_0194225876 /NCGR_PEP_ID=MMETSP0156-20130528/40556_1 /TAXON_ID=33649 /ORGANISM="Thalassionema nitzschioides, Strain L26-B" /LENGTH=408 /DNA_ID=CAMNT_0038958005 /DNA_START=147 /DNA_END=1373 /DNA_ORIENTATION=-
MPSSPLFGVRPSSLHTTRSETSSTSNNLQTALDETNIENEELNLPRMSISTPLKFVGPYACLGLRFPKLATSAQRERNVTGVSLDFMVDTAANINVINAQVAKELQLPVVGQAPGGVGSSGAMMDGASIFSLGDTYLEKVLQPQITKDDDEEPSMFMQGLTASALTVASPASAGILSYAFLSCFEGGVEFKWGDTSKGMGISTSSGETNDTALVPSLVFYGGNDDGKEDGLVLDQMTKVNISPTPVTMLPTITILMNGFEVQALLDTGSPITVLNKAAAESAAIETFEKSPDQTTKKSNPFASVVNLFQEGKEQSMAAQRGELVMIPGADGQPVCLYRSKDDVDIGFATSDGSSLKFKPSPVFVGDIPGLAALNGLGDDSPPAMILGMDVLRTRSSMFLRAQSNEVYF